MWEEKVAPVLWFAPFWIQSYFIDTNNQHFSCWTRETSSCLMKLDNARKDNAAAVIGCKCAALWALTEQFQQELPGEQGVQPPPTCLPLCIINQYFPVERDQRSLTWIALLLQGSLSSAPERGSRASAGVPQPADARYALLPVRGITREGCPSGKDFQDPQSKHIRFVQVLFREAWSQPASTGLQNSNSLLKKGLKKKIPVPPANLSWSTRKVRVEFPARAASLSLESQVPFSVGIPSLSLPAASGKRTAAAMVPVPVFTSSARPYLARCRLTLSALAKQHLTRAQPFRKEGGKPSTFELTGTNPRSN